MLNIIDVAIDIYNIEVVCSSGFPPMSLRFNDYGRMIGNVIDEGISHCIFAVLFTSWL